MDTTDNWFSSNFNSFEPGEVITHNEILDNWDKWFGYPMQIAQAFLTKETVTDANEFLIFAELPFRVTNVSVVNGMRQWTIA